MILSSSGEYRMESSNPGVNFTMMKNTMKKRATAHTMNRGITKAQFTGPFVRTGSSRTKASSGSTASTGADSTIS